MTKFRLTCAVAGVATVAALGSVAGLAPAEQPIARNDRLAAPADVFVAMMPDEEREERERRDRESAEEHERNAQREAVTHRERVLHELERRRDELMERAVDLKRELTSVPEDAEGRSRELRGELEAVMGAAGRVQEEMAEVRHGQRPRHEGEVREHPEEVLHAMMREREELMEVGGKLRRELGELERAGHSDAAREMAQKIEVVTREFREVEARIAEMQGDPQRREPPRGEGAPPQEMERRMHHLQVAVENLHAAGLHEQAEQIARQAEHLAHQVDGPPREPLEDAVQDLQRQLQEMRRQMEQMQRALQMLMERDRR